MPPKKAPKTGSLLQFFAKQQEIREQESCQIVFEKKNDIQDVQDPLNATIWAEKLKENSKIYGEKSGKEWQSPCPIPIYKKSNDINTKKDLLEYGFDDIQGNGLFYPMDEMCRKFEMNIIRCCAASNACIALPSTSTTSPSKIAAILTFNFLKWFPRSRVLIVSQSSDEWAVELSKIGLDNQVSKVATVSQFKNLRGDVGRVLICTTPQAAVKIVELKEADDLLSDIRLVCLELKPNECCAKYKPILTALTVKDTFFRCVVITTSIQNTSRRTSSITKRQQLITNLQLSDWIEQSENDIAFRTSNIPSGIEVKYWKLNELDDVHLELIQQYEECCRGIVEELAKNAILPANKLQKLMWIDWELLKTTAKTHEIMEKVKFGEFICTVYSLLVIEGCRVAMNYIKKQQSEKVRKWKENDDTRQFMKKLEEKSSILHGKYENLINIVETFLRMDANLRGAILVKSDEVAIEIQKFLAEKLKSTAVIRMISNGQIGCGDMIVYQYSRLSTVFHDRKAPKIVILATKNREFSTFIDGFQTSELNFVICMDRESIFNLRHYQGAYLAILNENFEKLRNDDGRIVIDDGKPQTTKEKKNQKIGAVERYEFKFEPSRLKMDTLKLPILYFWPKKNGLEEGISQLGKSTIVLTSKEHVELMNRMKNIDFTRFRVEKSGICVLNNDKDIDMMDETELFWNDNVQYLGDIKSSKLSERFVEYIGENMMNRDTRHKKKFEYVDEITNALRVTKLEQMIRKLDNIFEFYT